MKHFKYIYKWINNQSILFFLFLISLIIPNVIFLFTEQVPIIVKITNIILPLSVFWFVMTLARKPGKIMWILCFFSFLAAFQLVLLYLFGDSVIAVDMFLNLVTTNSGEASELLSNILPALLFVVIYYGGMLTLAVFSINNRNKLSKLFTRNQRIYSGILFVIGIICMIISYFVDNTFRVKVDIYPVNACYNMCLAIDRDIKSSNYYETSKSFKFNSVTDRDAKEPELYVFIIGETARALNFGVCGYNRNTTPELDKIKNDLFIFRDALSQSNTTHKSVPMLLSSASAEDYDRVYKEKGIITAFKEAGYKTSFFSNQLYNHSFIDYFGAEADNIKYLKAENESKNMLDEDLLGAIKNEIAKKDGAKKFIVLHTYGSHFNYQGRYKKQEAFFKPDSIVRVSVKYKNELINAYDNSIRCTDSFIAKVINMVKNENISSAVLYTSDHAEDLYDDNRERFLHASPLPTFYQIYVPYIVWLSNEYKSKHHNIVDGLNHNLSKPISTNLVTFHTILSIAGITGNEIDNNFSITNINFKPTPRYYLNDHNKPMLLNDAGLRKQDVDAFKKYNIYYPYSE